MPLKEYSFYLSEITDEKLEILIAFLSESGFDSFQTDEAGLHAYTNIKMETGKIKELLNNPVFSSLDLTFKSRNLPEKNWNEEWERAYQPVIIEGMCSIVAPFHKKTRTKYKVVIDPKMSFGTGHHETTRLMVKQMLGTDLMGKTVLDIGCGTGVLGILAIKLGAKFVTAIDIDNWACENSYENYRRNAILRDQFEVIRGNSNVIPDKNYHTILANINRNVLMADMKKYRSFLEQNGQLIISGVLTSDRELIMESAKESGFQPISELMENNWLSIAMN